MESNISLFICDYLFLVICDEILDMVNGEKMIFQSIHAHVHSFALNSSKTMNMRKVHHSNIANVVHSFRRLKGIISDQQGHLHLHVLVWRVVMELVGEGANLDVIRPRED
jgi:hypothetical protein